MKKSITNQAVTMAINPLTMMSEANFFKGYSRWDELKGGYETWEESVKRVMNMHRERFAGVMTEKLSSLIDFAEQAYLEKLVLGAQRALQFGGNQILKHNARLYNCSFSYADRPVFFQHAMYLLLAGCGVGFSVQRHHVAKMNAVKAVNKEDTVTFVVPDSIEGWADCFGVMISSYMTGDVPFPEYQGKNVEFDISNIRPEGAYISGGFKAPGPVGLVKAIELWRTMLDSACAGDTATLQPIQVYDMVMHMADAVISGGVRRAATLCLFSKNDEAMMSAKTGDWFTTNPQRARSNNSALLVRSELTKQEFANLMDKTKMFGEPGFVFAEDTEFGFNPCVEIGMRGYTQDGRSGFQFCNLTETNGVKCTDLPTLLRASKAAAILGTLQAAYTDFAYLDDATREITEREALLGCSITGWMSNPDVLFNDDNMRQAASVIVEKNEMVAGLININPAARTTAVKPSGNASVLLGCASGIHGEHAPRYLRNVQMNRNEEVAQLMKEKNPAMVAQSVYNPGGTDWVVSFPITAPEQAMFKDDLLGVKQLEFVKKAQQAYIEAGTVISRCVDERLRHNVSNTISVDDWDEVEGYIFDNRAYFAGISLMGRTGDKAYAQAPFTRVYLEDEILALYNTDKATLDMLRHLIEKAQAAFNLDVWSACSTLLGYGIPESDQSAQQREWLDTVNTTGIEPALFSDMIKDVFNFDLWQRIHATMQPVNFSEQLQQKKYVDANTMGAQACAGGVCELVA